MRKEMILDCIKKGAKKGMGEKVNYVQQKKNEKEVKWEWLVL